jgi:hypothetical protein
MTFSIKKPKTESKKGYSGFYDFYLKKHYTSKSPEQLKERREVLRMRVKKNINDGSEWEEYTDLSFLIYKEKMNSKSFREKVWAGDV